MRVANDLCTFGETGSETVHHLFYQCSFSNSFWKYFENFCFTLSGQREDFTFGNVFVVRLAEAGLRTIFILCRKISYLDIS